MESVASFKDDVHLLVVFGSSRVRTAACRTGSGARDAAGRRAPRPGTGPCPGRLRAARPLRRAAEDRAPRALRAVGRRGAPPKAPAAGGRGGNPCRTPPREHGGTPGQGIRSEPGRGPSGPARGASGCFGGGGAGRRPGRVGAPGRGGGSGRDGCLTGARAVRRVADGRADRGGPPPVARSHRPVDPPVPAVPPRTAFSAASEVKWWPRIPAASAARTLSRRSSTNRMSPGGSPNLVLHQW